MPPSLRRLLPLLPLLAGFGVHAASLGEIDVESHLGEPLRARVPIGLDEGGISGDDCVRIVGPARHHPDLAKARIALISRSGRHYIDIRTDEAVNDPVLDLTLRADACGLSMQKDFVILLSPRGLAAEAAVVTATAPVAMTSAAPATGPAQPRVAGKTARHQTRAPRRQAPRFALRLDYGYEAFGQLADRIAQGRQAARLAGQAAAPAPTDRLVLKPPEDLPDLPGATPPGPAGPATDAAATGRIGIGNLAPTPVPDAAAPWSARLLGTYLLLPLLTILAAAAVAVWLKRRRLRGDYAGETAPTMDTLLSTEPEFKLPPPARDLPPVAPAPVEPPPVRPAPVEAMAPPAAMPPAEAMDEMMGIGAPSSQSEGFSIEPHDSFDHVMELAEVMLAFGRSSQAIEALSRHIHANPRQAVDPWLKLLDLYRQSGLRTEFDALATDLHDHYNIAMPDWDGYLAGPQHETGPLTLDALPHVMSRLTESWGGQAALDYLDKLLADNRGGQRLGFSMAMVRDILLLRDILRQVCPGAAFPH